MELRLTARRGENVLVTIVIPAAVLLFFASTGRSVQFLVPGAIGLAVIAAGLPNLGIATAYERSYGVLKRLGGAPIPRAGLIAAKLISILALEAIEVVLLLAVAVLVLGWQPQAGASPPLIAGSVVLGTVAFAGLGLLLAGTLRAEGTLALANALFLAFLMLGGVVVPVDELPAAVAAIARLLPAAALTDLLRAGFGTGAASVAGAAAILAAWAGAASILAVRTFRWE